jgi:subtilisin family serine protease
MSNQGGSRVFRPLAVGLVAAGLILAGLPAGASTDAPPAPRARAASGADVDKLAGLSSGGVGSDFVPGELIVTFRKGSSPASRSVALARVGARRAAGLGAPTVALVRLPAGADVGAEAARLSRHPAVEVAEPNWYRHTLETVPNDPEFPDLWGFKNTGQQHYISDPSFSGDTLGGLPDADADVTDAWDLEQGDAGTVVAVIDTGVNTTHPDLDGNLWANPGEAGGTPGVDDDTNGKVDDVNGWNFALNNANLTDNIGHGTHVAGTIAAEAGNATGVAGVCPDCSIMALRVADNSGGLSSAAVNQAIRYAANEGADVINLSLGGPQWTKAERDALKFATGKGALVVVAAGNEFRDNDVLFFDFQNSFIFGPSYPASYDLPGILAVAASDHRDRYGLFTGCLDDGFPLKICSFSNWGRTSVDLAAPGVDIVSTVPVGLEVHPDTPNGYDVYNGTSMASPFAAGVAALVRSANPGLSPVATKNVVMNAVNKPANLKPNQSVTNGRVNALLALQNVDTSNATPKHDGVMSGAVSIASRKSGKLAQPKDMNDIFKKRLRKGRTYEVTLDVPKSADFDLFVWKPKTLDTFPTDYCKGPTGPVSCKLQAASALGKGRDETVRFRASKSGVFYFHASVYKGSGKYVMTVRVR